MLEYPDMPRPRTVDVKEASLDVPKKRAPRKRAVPTNEDGEVKTPRPRAPRKRVVKELAIEAEPEPVRESTARRAPTPIAAERRQKTKGRRSLVIALLILTAFCGVGAVIGLSDSGQIDVVAVVNERNERINRGEVREGESTMTIPVQNTDARPNGGLVPADPASTPAPVVATSTAEVGTSTESTSESAATTTEATTTDDSVSDTPAVSDVEAGDVSDS